MNYQEVSSATVAVNGGNYTVRARTDSPRCALMNSLISPFSIHSGTLANWLLPMVIVNRYSRFGVKGRYTFLNSERYM